MKLEREWEWGRERWMRSYYYITLALSTKVSYVVSSFFFLYLGYAVRTENLPVTHTHKRFGKGQYENEKKVYTPLKIEIGSCVSMVLFLSFVRFVSVNLIFFRWFCSFLHSLLAIIVGITVVVVVVAFIYLFIFVCWNFIITLSV